MEAPTAGNEEDKLILEEVEKNKDDDYSLAKDYYRKSGYTSMPSRDF